jgi:hypothetical protein
MDMTDDPVRENKRWYLPTKKELKQWGGIIFRILLLGITLYFTIPAVTRVSIEGEIQKLIEDDNHQKIAGIIDVRRKQFEAKLYSKDSLLARKRAELINEVRGGPGSAGYGDKVVAHAIREAIEALEREITNTKIERDTTINRIYSSSQEELSRKYGIVFITKVPGEIERISKEMEKKENYQMVERISRTYAVLAFMILLLFKLFAPTNVTHYFNEDMQGLYEDYLYDQINPAYLILLQNLVKDTNKKDMTPGTFYDFWRNYRRKRYNDLKFMHQNENMRLFDEMMLNLSTQRKRVETTLGEAENACNQAFKIICALDQQLDENKSEAENFLAHKKELDEKIKEINAIDPSGINPEDFVKLAKQKPALQAALLAIEQQLGKNKTAKNVLEIQRVREGAALKFLQEELDRNRSSLEEISKAVQDMIDKYIRGLSSSPMRVA